uniref:Endoglucanase n=1 Tax=Antipaluria urichi TaxID=270842 RepID=A0A288QC65_9NEOP|nr:cellulase [Antipaluria urichi]
MVQLQCLSILFILVALLSVAVSYDYKQVLNYSMLFYEAQRSGKLPADQHVTWRKDSALGDKGNDGEDLTGGYYDAGDLVKFGFPMAYTITMLSWGVIAYQKGYEDAGLADNIHEAIKWGTDYFLECHVSENELYGQVGNGDIDHAWWGRPEDMTMERPAYKLTESAPGSELAGETAAALAAASIVFKNVNVDYSDELLEHAKQLFDFANNNRKSYVDSITDAAKFYDSFNGYGDELVWAAAWLAKATNDQSYLDKANDLYEEFSIASLKTLNLSWGDKTAGIEALMSQITDSDSHKQKLKSYVEDVMNNRPRTPKGLVYLNDWGSLRYSANAVFIAMRTADLGIDGFDSYISFAKSQIGYMLGDTGRSFVVGFGENFPTHAHHRASSCPDIPIPCDYHQYNATTPNPHMLYGALVGGPDENDQYTDVRTDYEHNEVACDYNAAFSGVLAAFIQHGY